MNNLQFAIYRDAQSNLIPEKPGIYAFFLANVSRDRLGLRFGFNEDEVDAVRARVNKRIRENVSLFNQGTVHGGLSRGEIAAHISPTISLHGTLGFSESPDEVTAENRQQMEGIIAMLEAAVLFVRPLYVGITHAQTLRQRYSQHRRDYFQENPKGFGGRLRNFGVQWEDTIFQCIERDSESLSKKDYLAVEDYLQILSQPVLSMK